MSIFARASLVALATLSLACGDDGGSADTEPSTSGSSSTAAGSSTTAPAPTSTDGTSTAVPGSSSSTDDTSDAGSSTGGSSDGVPMFVALGQGGRSLISCDDGQSWVAEQSIDGSNDDHGPYSARDVAAGDGVFLLGMGWGNPARIHVSTDGVAWEETFPPPDYQEMRGLSGIAFGEGRFVAVVGADSWTSTDAGQTWTLAGQLPTGDNIRVVTHAATGRFFAAADGGVLYSSSDGATWSGPLSTTGSCDGGNLSRRGGIADRDGVFVLVTDIGNVCRSDDGGATITHHVLGSGNGDVVVRADVVATDEGFYTAGRDTAWHSPDGISWNSTAFTLDGDDIATLGCSRETETLVGIAWNGDDFYRSTDGGRSWVRAEAPQGNDVNQVEFGYATASEHCPG